MTDLERRDLVVSGALPRHQMRSYLKHAGIDFWWGPGHEFFRIWATSEQWEKINEWVEQTKVER